MSLKLYNSIPPCTSAEAWMQWLRVKLRGLEADVERQQRIAAECRADIRAIEAGLESKRDTG